MLPEAKKLPDDCDYRRLYESFLKAEKNVYSERKVLKVSYEGGRLNRFDALEAPKKAMEEIIAKQTQSIAMNQQLTAQQRYQADML